MSELRGTLFGRCACCLPPMGRREFLAGGIAALGLGAFAAGRNAAAQAKPHRIDVHHHVSPPSWLDAVKKAKLDNPPMVNWLPQKSLDDMDQAGIATAIVSPTTPQVNFLDHDKDAAARFFAPRSCANARYFRRGFSRAGTARFESHARVAK